MTDYRAIEPTIKIESILSHFLYYSQYFIASQSRMRDLILFNNYLTIYLDLPTFLHLIVYIFI